MTSTDSGTAGMPPAAPRYAQLAEIGAMRQVCRIDRLVHEEGPARGARLVRMVTGGGLELEIHPDRCLDIGAVTFRGAPVAWSGPAPPAAPAFVDPHGDGWLRTFSGGLLVTCGLDQVGSPSQDGPEPLGLHGRASGLAAEHLSTRAAWTTDGRYELEVSARMRQARLFGENLVLERRISSAWGAASFTVEDTVRNEGRRPHPHLLLHHVNLGWPLLEEGAVVDVPSVDVIARDNDAAAGLAHWREVPPPAERFPEQVLRHDLPPEPALAVSVTNTRRDLRLEMQVDGTAMPYLFQWRLFESGVYVMGLEPSTVPTVDGRGALRAMGAVPELQPGEQRTYRLDIAVGPAAG
ncbi:DUF4432 family protein [Actinomycetes bacterium KLBMP 9759]